MDEMREKCPLRHENGNCWHIGGFCTAINDSICSGLRNAYEGGKRAVVSELMLIVEQQGYVTVDDIIGVYEEE